MKKSHLIITALFLIVLGAGVLIWQKQKESLRIMSAQQYQVEPLVQPPIIPKDHVLARAQKTAVIDLDGPAVDREVRQVAGQPDGAAPNCERSQ